MNFLILTRYVRDLSKQPISEARPVETGIPVMSSSVSSKKQIFEDLISEQKIKSRTKRQSAGRNALCETRTQFIQPQAALNNKGKFFLKNFRKLLTLMLLILI